MSWRDHPWLQRAAKALAEEFADELGPDGLTEAGKVFDDTDFFEGIERVARILGYEGPESDD